MLFYMTTFNKNTQEIDRHQIKPDLAGCRIGSRGSLGELEKSLAEFGQQVPVIVAGQEGSWVLIDGYRRWKALGRMGQDTLLAEVWDCKVGEALIQVLAQEQKKPREALEEAHLIRELIEVHEMSQKEVGLKLGKHPIWVSRRLMLLAGLSEDWQKGLQEGWLKPWVVNRVLKPLERINENHAARLVETQQTEKLSTPQLAQWYGYYQQATRPIRQNMVDQPRLFLKSLENSQQEAELQDILAGPEGACLKDSSMSRAILKRLERKLPGIWDTASDEALGDIQSHLQRALGTLSNLCEKLEEKRNANRSRDGFKHPEPTCPGNGDSGDSPNPEHGEEHGQEIPEHRCESRTGHRDTRGGSSRGYGRDPKNRVQVLQEERGANAGDSDGKIRPPDLLQHPDTLDSGGGVARGPQKSGELSLCARGRDATRHVTPPTSHQRQGSNCPVRITDPGS